ncbi:hypothetical protein [Streptomyces sp. NPDC050428]|uniref:hypothetical protein n=1 Tax=Streptomyces sp. NPDC050428 TaxID=3155757 RepID=UPI00342B45D5
MLVPRGVVVCDAAPAAGTTEEAAALRERLGGLPLALDTAGHYLASPTGYHTFTAYQHALETEFSDLVGAEHPQAADPEIARTVVQHTFDLSLTPSGHGHEAQRARRSLRSCRADRDEQHFRNSPGLRSDGVTSCR